MKYLTSHRLGRIVLHITVLILHHKHLAYHIQGIIRDIKGV